MSAKFKLGVRPEAFAPVAVSFTAPEGGTVVVNVTFKYRTREEYGQFVDSTVAAMSADDKPVPEGQGRVETFFSQSVEADAALLAGAVHAWDLDEPPTPDNLRELASAVPAGSLALLTAYRQLVAEGKLGN